ncbi:hypothetical protein QR721_11645 [Aciduricibacillus chroicocephali]|uniref:Uncharacterized protein n=1 Tax=Aciduricibacillus chroicocephali TaxID=3054939 RepID=A0ABY9KTY3_9BACI|nr:hypothetical protein QR721_11645 [Bacillaceae bacterium 44XB]
MANEIFLNPDGFEAEVKSLKTAVEGVEKVKFEGVSDLGNKTILDSMSAMIAAIKLFEEMRESYTSFSKKDVKNLEAMKEAWVTKDLALAESMKGD